MELPKTTTSKPAQGPVNLSGGNQAPLGQHQESTGHPADRVGRAVVSDRRPAGDDRHFCDGGAGRGAAFLSGNARR